MSSTRVEDWGGRYWGLQGGVWALRGDDGPESIFSARGLRALELSRDAKATGGITLDAAHVEVEALMTFDQILGRSYDEFLQVYNQVFQNAIALDRRDSSRSNLQERMSCQKLDVKDGDEDLDLKFQSAESLVQDEKVMCTSNGALDVHVTDRPDHLLETRDFSQHADWPAEAEPQVAASAGMDFQTTIATCSLSPNVGLSPQWENSAAVPGEPICTDLILFEKIELNETESHEAFYADVLPLYMVDPELEANAQLQDTASRHAKKFLMPSRSMGHSLTGVHEMKGSYQNDNYTHNTDATPDLDSRELATTTITRELKVQCHGQPSSFASVSLSTSPRIIDHGESVEKANSLSSSYTGTASSNESRVRGSSHAIADGHDNIDFTHEKDVIVSKMLGKKDATSIPGTLGEQIKAILEDFESYWKNGPPVGGPTQERSLRCFQRTITMTLNSFCEREKRRVRYLPDFCKDALSEWVAIEAHQQNPYPDKCEIRRLAKELGLTTTQVEQWFENYRVRNWKPAQSGIRKGKFFRYPTERTAVLKKWILDHKIDPKPQGKDLKDLTESTGMTSAQVKQWCYNFRRRHRSDMQP